MAGIQFYKVITLPDTPEPNAFYFVKNEDFAESYITDNASVLTSIGNSDMINSFIAEKAEQNDLDDLEDRVVTLESSSDNGSDNVSLSQLSKLGIIATEEEPKDIEIIIPETTDFKRLPLEVLIFIAGSEDVIQTQIAFDNGDETDFEADDQLIFNGSMRLKTNYEFNMTDDGSLGDGKQFSFTINPSDYKNIEGLEVK